MQDGVHSRDQATDHLPRSGGPGADILLKGAQGQDGVGLQIVRSSSADGGRSNQCSGSIGGRVASSHIQGHGSEDLAQEHGVVSVARNGVPVSVPGLRHGGSTVSDSSSEDGRRRRTHFRSRPSVSPSRVEVRAGAVSAYSDRETRSGGGGGGAVGHDAKEATDSRMVHEVSPRHQRSARGEAEHRKAQRNPQAQQTIPNQTRQTSVGPR